MGEVTRRLFIGGGLATAGLALAGCESGSPSSVTSQPPEPPLAEFGLALSDSLFLPLDANGDQEVDTRLSMAHDLGVRTIRVDFDGSEDQLNKGGPYDWRQNDRIVSKARAKGLRILATVSFTPPWNQNPNPDGKQYYAGRPRDPEVFVDFAGAVAEHYIIPGKDDLDFEIWNEEDASPPPDGADPTEYATLFNLTNGRIKQVLKTARVAIGGLAPKIQYPGTMGPTQFLEAVLSAGAEDFDAVGLHPYTWPSLPLDASPDNAFTQIEGAPGVQLEDTIYSILAKRAMGNMPIWLTEMGAPSAGGPGLSQELEAETIRQILTHKFAQANVMKRIIFTLVDNPQTGSGYFGLYDQNLRAKKPVVEAFQSSLIAA